MSLGLFNRFGAGRPLVRSTGMVLATVSDPRAASGTKQPYEVRPLHLPAKRLPGRSPTPQKPLRADDPVTLVAWLDPRRVTARAGGSAGESRPPAVVGSSSRPHRLSSSDTRSSGRIGRPRRTRAASVSSGLISSPRPPTGHRSGGQSMQAGSGVCRSTTREVEPHETVVRTRSPWCPGSASSSPDRAGGRASRSVHVVFSSPGVLVFARLSPSGTASGRTAPACATGGRRTGRSGPPGSPGPCACPASSPAAASSS